MSYWINFQERTFNKQHSRQKATINKKILYNFALLLSNIKEERIMICDIGGGSGANVALMKQIIEKHIKKHVYKSVVCDISIVWLKNAKKIGNEPIKCSVTHLPFRNHIFDMGFNVHVLEHLVDDRKAILEIGRIIKQNGLLYVGAPNKATNLYLPFIVDNHILGRNPLHLRSGYDADTLITTFRQLNFKKIIVKYHGYWGAFFAHFIKYLFSIFTFLLRIILKYQNNELQVKINNLQETLFKWDNIFGNENPHAMNFFIFLQKQRTI